jgi:hypothetical protein
MLPYLDTLEFSPMGISKLPHCRLPSASDGLNLIALEG